MVKILKGVRVVELGAPNLRCWLCPTFCKFRMYCFKVS